DRAIINSKIAEAEARLAAERQNLARLAAHLYETRHALIAAHTRPAHLPKRPFPAVLFPIRIETCFRESQPGKVVLQVRLYPDQIAIETYERELTEDEVRYAQRYAQDMASTTPEMRQDGWRRLARRLGVHRAAWIERLRERNAPFVVGRTATWTRA